MEKLNECLPQWNKIATYFRALVLLKKNLKLVF